MNDTRPWKQTLVFLLSISVCLGRCSVVFALSSQDDKPRPVLHQLGDLPVAYVMGEGFVELSLNFPSAGSTLDPFQVGAKSLVGDLAPGPSNPGYPHSLSGHFLGMNLGLGPRWTGYFRTGRHIAGFEGHDMDLNRLEYGLKINLISEQAHRPALAIDLKFGHLTGAAPLESTLLGYKLFLSKSVTRHFFVHGNIGLTRYKNVTQVPGGPPPQLGGAFGVFPYPANTFETGLALTWQGGRRLDATLGYDRRRFDRAIDPLIPEGGIADTDRMFLHVSRDISPSLVINIKVERESQQLAGLYPFLYNPTSRGSFTQELGWLEFGITLRADLGSRSTNSP